MYHYLFLFTRFLFFMMTKSFKVYMYVYIKFCDVAYSYFFVLILCMHCDNFVVLHMFVEEKALQGLCYMFVIFDTK